MSVTITISDDDYRDLARVLSKILTNPKTIILDAVPQAPVNPTTPAPTHQPTTTQNPMVTMRDRWARDRQGGEEPNPKGAYLVHVHIFKAERKNTDAGTERMIVAFDSPTGKGTVTASCWDERLFPFIAVQAKEPKATLHIVKKGKYLNVVGVRA